MPDMTHVNEEPKTYAVKKKAETQQRMPDMTHVVDEPATYAVKKKATG